MSESLNDRDVEFLRRVSAQSTGSIFNIPTGRAVTAENLGKGKIELRVRSTGPADRGPEAIADQVLALGWQETRSLIPDQRAFRGSVPSS
jgi:hypothetical protein